MEIFQRPIRFVHPANRSMTHATRNYPTQSRCELCTRKVRVTGGRYCANWQTCNVYLCSRCAERFICSKCKRQELYYCPSCSTHITSINGQQQCRLSCPSC